jgi:hypothetical protein
VSEIEIQRLMQRPVVIVESPFRAELPVNAVINKRYLAACMRYAFLVLDVLPFASHGLYTQDGVLIDADPFERALGIAAGLAIGRLAATETYVFEDLGISHGMELGIKDADRVGRTVSFHKLPADILAQVLLVAV